MKLKPACALWAVLAFDVCKPTSRLNKFLFTQKTETKNIQIICWKNSFTTWAETQDTKSIEKSNECEEKLDR